MDCPDFLRLIYEKELESIKRIMILYFHIGDDIDFEQIEREDEFWKSEASKFNGIISNECIIFDQKRYLQFQFESIQNLKEFADFVKIYDGKFLNDYVIREGTLIPKPTIEEFIIKINQLCEIHCN